MVTVTLTPTTHTCTVIVKRAGHHCHCPEREGVLD
jgi:hypothetical protein